MNVRESWVYELCFVPPDPEGVSPGCGSLPGDLPHRPHHDTHSPQRHHPGERLLSPGVGYAGGQFQGNPPQLNFTGWEGSKKPHSKFTLAVMNDLYSDDQHKYTLDPLSQFPANTSYL